MMLMHWIDAEKAQGEIPGRTQTKVKVFTQCHSAAGKAQYIFGQPVSDKA